MAVHWAVLLIVVELALTPKSVWAARQLFAGDLLAEAARLSRQDHSQAPEVHNGDPGDDDLLDLIHREYDPPFGSNGYGGYGHNCPGYGGYGGYGGGYGESAMDSDAAFEDLITLGADLQARHHDHNKKHNLLEYDVYGVTSGSKEDDARMALRAEEAHLLELDLLDNPAHGMGDPEYDTDDDPQWDDLLGASLPFPEASPSPHGCYGGYYGGCHGCNYGGYYGGCHGGYGDHFEELFDDPHDLGPQEALMEVTEKLLGGGRGGKGKARREEDELLL